MRMALEGEGGLEPRLLEGPSPTPGAQHSLRDLGRGVLGDHGVGGEFGVQNAAVRVGAPMGSAVQQLAVFAAR